MRTVCLCFLIMLVVIQIELSLLSSVFNISFDFAFYQHVLIISYKIHYLQNKLLNKIKF